MAISLTNSPQRTVRRSAKSWKERILPYLFLLPLLVVNFVVIFGPSVASIFYAFTDWSGVGAAKFIGLANFVRLVADPLYFKALRNNLLWMFIFLTVPISMGLLAASFLASIKRGQMFFRLAFFFPYVLAPTVSVQMWRYILHPSYGIGATLAKNFGWQWANIKFLSNTSIVLPSIAFMDNWQWWGFLAILYLAAMQAIDTELYEAARLDGANRWQEFIYVTVPGIRATLGFTLMMTMIWSFLSFNFIWLTTGGGPAHASEVMSTLLYQKAFQSFEVGYAAAIGLSMSFFCGLVALGVTLLRRKGWEV